MKREIVLKFKDGSEKRLELSVATKLKIDAGMLNFDRMKDGRWRMIWSEDLIDDFTQLDRIEIYRED